MPRVTLEEPEDILFTEITEPAGAGRREPAMSGLATEALLAAGYALFLLSARRSASTSSRGHSHRRSRRYRTAGFTLPPPPRRLGVPGGRAPLRRRRDDHERRARPLPGAAARLQRLPRQGALHRLGRGARDRPLARPVAPLRGGALPPRHLRRARGAGGLIAVVVLLRHHEPVETALLVAVVGAAALVARVLVAELRAPPVDAPAGVTSYDYALLFHLVAVIGFFAGVAVAAAAQVGAWRLDRPGEVAAVLRLARNGVLVVALAAILLFVSGLWLIEETGHSLGDGWIAVSLLLLVVSAALGAIGAEPKPARQLAERSTEDAQLDPEIRALLRDRGGLVANALAFAAAFGILVLMVWRPD